MNQIYSALSASQAFFIQERWKVAKVFPKFSFANNEEKLTKSDDNLANAAKPASAEKSQTCPH
jgi:hypothetical protein